MSMKRALIEEAILNMLVLFNFLKYTRNIPTNPKELSNGKNHPHTSHKEIIPNFLSYSSPLSSSSTICLDYLYIIDKKK